ncbi:hypothetical protein Rsub_01825 [Raphidocelis subcapitata]|uniref:GCK domain-containing protein n=1 Tax=Raphidocelis subcapitata TaxID=307507 RepID=A0A2V0NNG3_9CHLO|nr:hypothetical protein Rsub_01825 [Raphidocelis subcapitata]|eukprot:GBF89108.1 hypothetical protein Rsub_01825 [Raphidocelis subcapitata]
MPGEAPPSAPAPEKQQQDAQKDDNDDKEECAWCKYMKAGGCREPFEAWQACVDSVMGADVDTGARKEAVDKCSGVTQPLFECMMRNRDYYGPQLEGMSAAGSDGPSGSGAGSSGSGGGSSAAAGSGSAAAATGGGGGGGAPAGGRVSVSVSAPGAGAAPAAAPS